MVRAWLVRPNSLTPIRKRAALVLRSLTILCLVLALAGAQRVTLSKNVSVIFLMDRSLSTGGDSQKWQREFAGRALAQRGIDDQFGVALFGKNSRLELPAAAHNVQQVEAFSAVVDRSASGLTTAMRFAATAFPGDSASRLVILSDGQSTEVEVFEEAQALAAAGIEVWTVPLPDDEVPDLLLSRLETPDRLAVDEPFLLKAVVESSGISEAELLVTADGAPVSRLKVKLQPGPNLFLVPQRRSTPGPVQFQARVISSKDRRPENNKGDALAMVGSVQSVLVLRSETGPGSLVPLLQSAGLTARAVTPDQLPRNAGAWRDTSALLIEDVTALDWSVDLQAMVGVLVRDGGMGFMMLGSDSTFGVGAYQHTAIEPLIPVNLAIRRPKDMPLAALIQLLDKSGSMGGRPIELAREAAIAAGETLSELDLLGVVGFDEAARWVYPFSPKGDGNRFKKSVAGLRAGGGTDLYPAMNEGLEKLIGAKAPLKHIIILSDGAVAPGDYDGLVKKAVEHSVTVSAVALGSGADIAFLKDLTSKGKGRLFVAADAGTQAPLPQIFIRDTLLATGSGIQQEPTKILASEEGHGSPILAGMRFDNAAPLLGYNMSSPKSGTAGTLLQSPKGDPILAIGRAGIGKTAAWTSDLGGTWAQSWLTAPGAGSSSLLETLLLRSIREINAVGDLTERSRSNRLEATASTVGDMTSVNLTMRTREPLNGPVKAVVVNGQGETVQTILHPETPYLARGSVQVTEPGSSIIFAQDTDGSLLARCNLSVPLAPEFSQLGTDQEVLRSLAQNSGGRYDPKAEDIFASPEKPFPVRSPLGWDLVRGALLLLLLEVAVRRLPVPKKFLKAFKASESPSTHSETHRSARTLTQLRAARDTKDTSQKRSFGTSRATEVRRAGSPGTFAPPIRTTSEDPSPTKSSPPSSLPEAGSTMARLKAAKKRSEGQRPSDH